MSTSVLPQEIIGYIGFSIGLSFIIAPVFLVMKLFKEKDRVNAQTIISPLIVTFVSYFSCCLWFAKCYAKTDSYPQFLYYNLIGIIIDMLFIVAYLYLCFQKKIVLFVLFSILVLALTTGIIVFVLTLKITQHWFVIPILASVFNALMYVTPGLNIIKAFKEKKSRYIPIVICCIGCINCLLWGSYAFFYKELFIYILLANVVGLVICVIEIILYNVFEKDDVKEIPTTKERKTTTSTDSKEEYIQKYMSSGIGRAEGLI
jgi:hypothetical protein